MAVPRNLAVAIQVVEQHELAGELVVVGRHLLAEHHELGIAVPFFDVAEHLIVGAILFDDVNHVFDRAGSPTRLGITVLCWIGERLKSASEYGQLA